MKIAADKCIYSNHNFVMKKIGGDAQKTDAKTEDKAGNKGEAAKSA